MYSDNELGEYWGALYHIYNGVYDCGSPEFKESYEKEVESQYEYLTKNFKIVETKEFKEITYKELVYKDE